MVCRGAYVGKLSYCAAEWLGAGIPGSRLAVDAFFIGRSCRLGGSTNL